MKAHVFSVHKNTYKPLQCTDKNCRRKFYKNSEKQTQLCTNFMPIYSQEEKDKYHVPLEYFPCKKGCAWIHTSRSEANACYKL